MRAGDLFLSQSSKWLHFGGSAGVAEAEVLWPGGARQRFSGISSGGRFLLKQGEGVAKAWTDDAWVVVSALWDEPLSASPDDGRARIILPARIPCPPIAYRDQAAQPAMVRANGKPQLLIMWSGTCPNCQEELRTLCAAEQPLRAAGIDVIALAVDGLAGPAADVSAAYDLIDAVGFPFPWGLIDAASAERIQRLQAALFDRTPASAVPLAILLDELGNAVAIYRGRFAVADVLQDWHAIKVADERQLYHLAPPLRGSWFTNPLGREDLVRFLGGLLEP